MNLTSVVTVAVLGFFLLFTYLFVFALFYGLYHFIAAISPSTVPPSPTGKIGTIEDILVSVYMGLIIFERSVTFFAIVFLILIAIGTFIFSEARKYFTTVDAPV